MTVTTEHLEYAKNATWRWQWALPVIEKRPFSFADTTYFCEPTYQYPNVVRICKSVQIIGRSLNKIYTKYTMGVFVINDRGWQILKGWGRAHNFSIARNGSWGCSEPAYQWLKNLLCNSGIQVHLLGFSLDLSVQVNLDTILLKCWIQSLCPDSLILNTH